MVKHLLEDLDILGFGKTKFVMDRGFYSEDNINGLYRELVKFLVKGAEDEHAFDKRIAGLCREVKTTPKRGRQIYYKEDVIKEARRYLGYFAIITNETMDAFTALDAKQKYS